MKEYLSLLARYNEHVNQVLYAIVAELREADRTADVGSYHKSIFGLLSHIYASDVGWLRRSNEAVGPFESLAIPELGGPPPQWGVPMFKDFETLRVKRPVLDRAINELIAEIPQASLEKVYPFTNRGGAQKDVVVWQTLIHMFNHETHHRGAISEILDEMKVTNDYSSLIALL